MTAHPEISAYRVEKLRRPATIMLSSGEAVDGSFFLAHASAHHPGPERVGELLNAEPGFFPFELRGEDTPRTVLLNRAEVLTVRLSDDEAKHEPGYDVATPHLVAIGLSRGPRLMGEVRVYGPGGHDRLSDWTRDPEPFRYLECGRETLLVNMRHVIDVSEALR
ncbi:MAG: hypothetical protein AB7H81_21250 [Vicinamibacterales bacterium]